MSETQEILPDDIRGDAPPSPNPDPAYTKCLTCPDYGTTCRGIDITSFKEIKDVRACHKAIRRAKGPTLKAIHKIAWQISESTISDYFGAGEKDFKWTTVVLINDALLNLCGNRVGMPPIDHSCPASSSEHRSLLAAADLNLAAANLNLANMQNECDSLRRQLAEADGTHMAQVAQIQASSADNEKWFKEELRFWRRFAFCLVVFAAVLLALLVFYIGFDAAHAADGLIRY